MNVKNCFSERLKKLRTDSGMNQEEFADKIGVSRGSISFYEKAQRTADIETLYKVAEYFDVSVEYLLGISPVEGSFLPVVADEGTVTPDLTPYSKMRAAEICSSLSYCFSLYESNNCQQMIFAINKFLSDIIQIYTSAAKMIVDKRPYIDISTKLFEISTVSSSGAMRSLSFLSQSEVGANAGVEVNTASSFYSEYGGNKDGNGTTER